MAGAAADRELDLGLDLDLRRFVLPAAAIVLAVGTVLFVLSLMAGLLGMSDLVAFYADALPTVGGERQGWNTVVFLVSPFVMLTGGWYVWEQYRLRRDFNALIETRKKSDFLKEVGELEHIARRLPDEYAERLEERKRELNI